MTETTLPPNMQEFNEITTVIFAQLYIQFPMPKDLSADEVAKTLELSGPDVKPPSGRQFNDVFVQVVIWLINEGYIHSPTPVPLARVSLTSKALTVMNAVPTRLSAAPVTQSLGTQIMTAATDTSSASGKTFIGQVMGAFFGSISKSF